MKTPVIRSISLVNNPNHAKRKHCAPAIWRLAAPLLALGVLLPTAHQAEGRENHYDVVAKTIAPLVDLFLQKPKKPHTAVRMSGVVERVDGLPEASNTARIELALQRPDHVRLEATMDEDRIALCRRGEKIWAWPGEKFRPLLRAVSGQPGSTSTGRLGPFRLPVPDNQAVFFPALLQVTDGGYAKVNGKNCRRLTLRLMPELAESRGVKDSSLELWVRISDYSPARLHLRADGFNTVILVDKVEYLDKLPDEGWEPSDKEKEDLLQLSGAQLIHFLNTAAQQPHRILKALATQEAVE